jgi:hypothetical protein
MAQPPFQTDELQIEPAATGTRKINRASSGELRLLDPSFPLGLVLADLAGLQTVDGVYVVGQGGGATYTSIQDALDAIPTTSSPLLPSVVLVLAGVYTENLSITRDGVAVVGVGSVTISNSGASDTITVSQDADTTPTHVVLQNLTITNDQDLSCVFVNGENTFASGTATVNNTLAAGDVLTIGGITLTGVAGARTSGSDNFDASLGTVNALAAEIELALTDPANSFAASVTADAVGAVVTITSLVAGAAGNAITLTSLTVPGGGITVSGATLAGGGGANSAVASEEVALLGCVLKATSAGAYQLTTDTVNNVRVQGGTWAGSSITSSVVAVQTASLLVDGVAWTNRFDVAYDTGNDQPLIATSEFRLTNCGRAEDVSVNLIGAGSIFIGSCPEVGDIAQAGDRTLTVVGSKVGTVFPQGTTVAKLIHTSREGLNSGGTPTLAETVSSGSVAFVASVLETTTFDVPQPDTNYSVHLDSSVLGNIPQVTAKTTADFTIETPGPLTDTVRYTVIRDVS